MVMSIIHINTGVQEERTLISGVDSTAETKEKKCQTDMKMQSFQVMAAERFRLNLSSQQKKKMTYTKILGFTI